jgi:hypothetical protein
MSSISEPVRKRPWDNFNVGLVAPSDRYLLVAGRAINGGREIFYKSFEENQRQTAYDEAWGCYKRGYIHMILVDVRDGGRVLESQNVTEEDGTWVWNEPSPVALSSLE